MITLLSDLHPRARRKDEAVGKAVVEVPAQADVDLYRFFCVFHLPPIQIFSLHFGKDKRDV